MRVHATKFDGDGEEDDTEDTDKAVEKWSEKWRREGNGEWCYGKVTFVFRKKPRQPQKYRIKYHEGTVMESLETDIELAPEEEAEDETSSAERQLGEDENQLRLEDREEEPDEDDRHPLDREEEEDPTIHCKHVPLGQYRVTSGTYKGSLKSKQARCKYCPLRKRKQGESTVSPPTCFWCSFHEVAICRKHNCWERHLTEVTRNHIDGLDI